MTGQCGRDESGIKPVLSCDVTRGAQLLTADEAAARLRMSERTLRKLRQAGQIAYIALTDRMFRYTPEDCDAFIASRRRQEQPRPPRMPTGRRTVSTVSKGTNSGFMAFRAARKRGSERRPIEVLRND